MKYTVLKAIRVPTGIVVGVSKEQAAARGEALLKPVKGRQYECLVPVWFKAGETLDMEHAPKYLLASLQAHEGKPARAASEDAAPVVPVVPDAQDAPAAVVETAAAE